MDPKMYEMEAQSEASHWWFLCRRKLFRAMINGLGSSPTMKVLDVGTSTGTNLRLLRGMGFEDVTGIDSNQDAIRYCAEKGFGNVMQGDVLDLPILDDTFDLVLATDIIEHIDNDTLAICELTRVLKPGGKLLITVPTFMALWGHNDDMSHHKRRYTGEQISKLALSAGLKIVRRFYFNFLLFLPIWAVRQLVRRLVTEPTSEMKMNSPVINWALFWIFSLDVMLAPILHPPFGVSYLIVCEKLNTDGDKF